MYKVRFHLARGANFMKWQPTDPNGDKQYFNPEHKSIAMFGCRLRVQPSKAQEIHDGANKSVCAWIECEHLQVSSRIVPMTIFDTRISFNPKKSPHWLSDDGNKKDGDFIPLIVTNDRDLFVIPTYD